jgi:hypothetical protein
VTSVYPRFVESAALTAAIEIVVLKKVVGAVYRPVCEIVPTVAFPPRTLFTYHLTSVLVVFDTVAVICRVPPRLRVAVLGVEVIPTGAESDVESLAG